MPDGIEQNATLEPVTLLPELVNNRGNAHPLSTAGPLAVGPTTLKMISAGTAGRLWQQIDRAVVDRAALLPIGVSIDLTVTSRRAGNHVHQPGNGVLFDQLWVKPGFR